MSKLCHSTYNDIKLNERRDFMDLFLSIAPDVTTWGWLGVAIFLGVIEAIAINVIAIWFVIGAVLTIPLTFFDTSFGFQLIWFSLVSVGLLVTTRPFVLRYFKIGGEKTNLETLIDAEGMVLTPNQEHEVGELKIEGKVWRFQSLSKTIYQPSDLVMIREIKGVTLWVD